MVQIIINMEDGESVTKNVYMEDGDSPTWIEMCTAFFTALQGFGYVLPATPEDMTGRIYEMKVTSPSTPSPQQ